MDTDANAAISTLNDCAFKHAQDDRLESRLADTEALLQDDLEWVEEEIIRASRDGEQPATDAAHGLVSVGGKRVRPLAVLLAHHCFSAAGPEAREMAAVVELIHTATLLHDDVIDDGMTRRGQPTARRVWGNAVSVLAGDVLLVNALGRTQRHAPELMPALLEALRCLVNGEVIQLRGRSEFSAEENVYYQILQNKTASLFKFATHTGATLAGASAQDRQRLETFGDNLGMAFQLVDDVLDYTSTSTGKPILADLREGKCTLPLVLALAMHPHLKHDIEQIVLGDSDRVGVVKEAVLASGACEEVRRRALKHTERAIASLVGLPKAPAVDLLRGVAEQLADRSR